MPSSIPYDHPSLVLGNIVNPLIMSKLKQIGELQSKIDTAQDKMNGHIMMKRSLGMTINEMLNMNVDISPLTEKTKDIDTAIAKAASEYITLRLANETSIQFLKEQIADLSADDSLESPVDFESSGIKKLPLSSDSLKLDAQYFSYEEGKALNSVGTIENYIRNSTDSLGSKASSEIAKAASVQINQQQQNHNLSGTLVITATCTHKNASLLSPCVIDVDKAIGVWNTMFPDNKINTADEKSIQALKNTEETKESKSLSVLSGATYGSSFVGMVHILKQDANRNGPSLIALADELQERLTVGSWFEEAAGGFGLDSTFADDIKTLLNTQKISAHITVVVMGAIPSVRSNQLQMGISKFTDFDLAKLTSGSSFLSAATSSEKKTIDQGATASKTGAKAMAIQDATLQSVMSGLGKIDERSNKVMDINTMMTSFEDYLQEVKKGDSGIPVSFYLKNITQQQLAKLWIDKYYPDNKENPQAN